MAGYLPGLDTTRLSSMDLENLPPPPGLDLHDDLGRRRAEAIGGVCILCLFYVVMIACIILPLMYYEPDVRYSVAIDSASALDRRTGVSFNLTLGVASRSPGAKACIDPGMYVEVSYRGAQLAASDPGETRRTCAKPRDVAAMPLVARGTMLPVGAVQDSLAAEMGQGAALFDLELVIPATTNSGTAYLLVSGCNASRVGDAAVSCDYRS